MAYETPTHRIRDVRKAAEVLRAARRVILTTHLNADGDGAGSQVAVAAWLRANGAEAWIVNPTPYPDMFRFMLPEDWVVPAGSRRAEELCETADLAAVLDTGEVTRIGRVKPLISHLPAVVVDHHPPGERPIGGTSLRDPAASATGELVYDVITAARGPWPQATLLGIYVAILTDTGGFRFSNSTAEAHEVVADLIRRGLDTEAAYNQVYGASPLRRFKLLQACLNTLEADEGVAWMSVPPDVFRDLGAGPEDLEGLVDYPRGVEGTEVALLFRRTNTGATKVSFRSTGPVDVNALAREFGGGGHVRAAGAALDLSLEESIRRVVDATRAAVARVRNEEG
ncbi:MAG: bifunctional oligoribonuclease/PAP phosphatase NrnA [Gemmatimonadales bacterium]|nr:MAG: bifunctional oligoribonuclease/PAP phosphatase NrnA [Gemmatimonadales bacterium]